MSLHAKALQRTALVSAFVNIALSIIKLVIGFLSGSKSLIADGLHSAADLLTDLLTFVILKVSRSHADETHPYGHGKFETFGTLLLSTMLLITAIFIGYDAIADLQSGEYVEISSIALWAAAISILANEGLFYYCLVIGKRAHSKMVIANAWHHRTDSLSSIAALIGIALSLLGYPMFDAIAALIVALIVAYAAVVLSLDAFNELVEGAAPQELIDQINTVVNSNQGAVGCHNLRARLIGGLAVADLHLEVSPYISVTEGHLIADQVEKRLITEIEQLDDITIHIDPCDQTETDSLNLPSREELIAEISATLSKTSSKATLLEITINYLAQGIEVDVLLSEKLEEQDKLSLIKNLEDSEIDKIRILIEQ